VEPAADFAQQAAFVQLAQLRQPQLTKQGGTNESLLEANESKILGHCSRYGAPFG
jgi:hypothetical protein